MRLSCDDSRVMASQVVETAPVAPSLVELKATELARWLQHKHDGTSTNIKKDLLQAGLQEKDRMFVWTDGAVFPNSRGLVMHILATSPDQIHTLHASSVAAQKILKAGLPSMQPAIASVKAVKRPAEKPAQPKIRKKVSLSAPHPPPAPQLASSVPSPPAAPAVQNNQETPAPEDHSHSHPARENHLHPDVKQEDFPPKVALLEKLFQQLMSEAYEAERKAAQHAVSLVLDGLASDPLEINVSSLKHLLQSHKVRPELTQRAMLLLEEYDHAMEVGAARVLSDLQTSAAAPDACTEPARSDEDLKQDIEALRELLASTQTVRFTPAYLAQLEKQAVCLEEELAQRSEQMRAEQDFRQQRNALIAEVHELLKAEERNLAEVIAAASQMRKLLEYL